MLVLSRKIGGKIVIGDSIIIEIVEVRGQTVSFGITAPKGMPIYREELFSSTLFPGHLCIKCKVPVTTLSEMVAHKCLAETNDPM